MLIVDAKLKNLDVSMKEVNVNIAIHLFNSILLQVHVSLRIAYRLMQQDVCFANLLSLFRMEHAHCPTVMSSRIMHVFNVKMGIISKKEFFVNWTVLIVFLMMRMATAKPADKD